MASARGLRPWRPGLRVIAASTWRTFSTSARWAASKVERSCRVLSISARSSSRRLSVVTAIPSMIVRSSGCRWRATWQRMLGRRWASAAVTSIGPDGAVRSSHSAAAARWLSTASGPQAKTAASHRARSEIFV